jgi:hypothetical protein
MIVHTATPWEIRNTQTKSGFSKNWREIYAKNKPVVCSAAYDSTKDGTVCGVQISEEDAEFIICACNCHDDLFGALSSLLRCIEADPGATAFFDLRHITAAQNALEKTRAFTDRTNRSL